MYAKSVGRGSFDHLVGAHHDRWRDGEAERSCRLQKLSSNRREDHEVSLHLLQNCMVYVNTLMLQQVLAQPHWTGRLTSTDLRALTPLIWEHVNPYGRFEIDMATRLPLN